MGWIKRVPPKSDPHRCLPPMPDGVPRWGPESIWECDKCGQRYFWNEDYGWSYWTAASWLSSKKPAPKSRWSIWGLMRRLTVACV